MSVSATKIPSPKRSPAGIRKRKVKDIFNMSPRTDLGEHNMTDEDIFSEISESLLSYELDNTKRKVVSRKNKVFVKLYSISVNFCDILGLLDIFPCGTIHSIKPYISYN